MTKITLDEAHNVIRTDYYKDVSGVVDSLHEAIINGELDSEEEAQDWLHETVDSHSRVIHIGKALECLYYCSANNKDAYADFIGVVPINEDGGVNWSILAYWAFLADIREDSQFDIAGWFKEKAELDDD